MLVYAIILQDTTVVAVARDALATVSGWATVGLAVAFAALIVVLLLILLELRGLSRSWRKLLTVAGDRSGPLIDNANSAVRNVDYISQVIRTDVERVNQAVSGLTQSLEDASHDVQGRLKDMSALMDLAQTEAEEAVLDAATTVRRLRAGAGALRLVSRRGASNDDGKRGKGGSDG